LRQRARFAGWPIPSKHNHVLRGYRPFRGIARDFRKRGEGERSGPLGVVLQLVHCGHQIHRPAWGSRRGTLWSSKAAVSRLNKAWAAEFGPGGSRVNAVSPAPHAPKAQSFMGDALGQLAVAAPAGRVSSPHEIADAILFLATDAASFVQGAVLPVDGGRAAI
jgi:NAD(P)-dependent dehydrogenase (short-subunit alcohol dehydrogenase family)